MNCCFPGLDVLTCVNKKGVNGVFFDELFAHTVFTSYLCIVKRTKG